MLGYLPWIASGLEGPVRVESDPDVGVRTGVPLYLGSLPLLVICAVVGGVGAGLVTLLARGPRVTAALAAFAGAASVVAVVLLQSATAVREATGGSFAADDRVITALFLTTAAAGVLGWGLGASALASRGMLGVAVGVLAGTAPTWLSHLVLPLVDDSLATVSNLSTATRWVGAGVLVMALVLIGVRPVSRLV